MRSKRDRDMGRSNKEALARKEAGEINREIAAALKISPSRMSK